MLTTDTIQVMIAVYIVHTVKSQAVDGFTMYSIFDHFEVHPSVIFFKIFGPSLLCKHIFGQSLPKPAYQSTSEQQKVQTAMFSSGQLEKG